MAKPKRLPAQVARPTERDAEVEMQKRRRFILRVQALRLAILQDNSTPFALVSECKAEGLVRVGTIRATAPVIPLLRHEYRPVDVAHNRACRAHLRSPAGGE